MSNQDSDKQDQETLGYSRDVGAWKIITVEQRVILESGGRILN